MKKRNAALMAIVTIFALSALGRAQSKSEPAPANRTRKIKLNYTGTGTVDDKHKVFVLVFDSDPFAAERLMESDARHATKKEPSTPGQPSKVCYVLGRQGAAFKDQALLFAGLNASPVYVTAFCDKSGTYDGRSDPASGSSIGLYGTKPDKPAPIKLAEGKAAEVGLAFDDSSTKP